MNETDADQHNRIATDDQLDENDSNDSRSASDTPEDQEHVLQLRVSQSLHRKIKKKAADECVSVQELLGELIAEGLVLRAWEIMERKTAMRSAPSHSYKGSNRYESRGGGRKSYGKGSRSDKHILDDRAAFVEYVRNQEKGGRK
ncbi:MAG: hypothetical protein OYH77_08585 [Pseudomonadota bacterium]|nr:hypothetical protein [Pseudomonadota bacterium]